MFGVVERRDKLLNLTSKRPHVEDERSLHAQKAHHQRGAREEDDEEGEAHHRRKPRREEVERVTRGHFGGEPTAERAHAEHQRHQRASELVDDYREVYHSHPQQGGRWDDGQREVDEQTRDRESHSHHREQQRKQDEADARSRSKAHHHPADRPQVRHDDLYVVQLAEEEEALSKDEETEQAAILEAVRTAYLHEQTRKRQPPPTSSSSSSSSDESKQVASVTHALERRERQQDEERIAAAIHHALRHSDSRGKVKQMVLHAMKALEEESKADAGQAEGQGADADLAKQVRDRDVAIVEDEVGRMWRQESVNATVDELDQAIGRVVDKVTPAASPHTHTTHHTTPPHPVCAAPRTEPSLRVAGRAQVKEGGKRIVEQLESTEEEQSDQAEVGSIGSHAIGRRPYHGELNAAASSASEGLSGRALLGVLLGLVLAVLLCAALLLVFMQHKERRRDYDEL